MFKNNKTDISLKERASQVNLEKKLKKIIPICMSCIAVLTVLVYVVSVMYSKFAAFSITINKYNYIEYGLSLSETSDFNNPTSSLDCRAEEVMTNIDGKSLDDKKLGAVDGEDSGENYLCYTFYLRNSGTDAANYSYTFDISKMTQNIDEAVRIRLITSLNDGEKTSTDYARVSSKKDDKGNYLPEEGTEKFYSKNIAIYKEVNNFQPGDVMKYTVVIWLEGNDHECVDDVIGGVFKIDMRFNILGGAEE